MYESDLEGLVKRFNAIKKLYSQLNTLKEKWSKKNNQDTLESFDYVKTRISSNIEDLSNSIRGWLVAINSQYNNAKTNKEKETLFAQKQKLEDMQKWLTITLMGVNNTELIANRAAKQGTADPKMVAKILTSLGNLQSALGLFNIGAAKIFIDDEHMEKRWEGVQKEFVEDYTALDKIRETLSSQQLRALSLFTDEYFKIKKKLELRKRVRAILDPIMQKIEYVSKILPQLPVPAELALVKERNPQVYAQAMTLEKEVMDPLATSIEEFLKEFRELLPDRITTILETSLKTLKNYIIGFE